MNYICWSEEKNQLPLDVAVDILDKLKNYCSEHNLSDVELYSIEDNRWEDPGNQRFDIIIRYTNSEDKLIEQKLLVLNGEIIDGIEFHKRFNEFYPR